MYVKKDPESRTTMLKKMDDNRPESNEYRFEAEPKFEQPNEDLDFCSKSKEYKNNERNF